MGILHRRSLLTAAVVGAGALAMPTGASAAPLAGCPTSTPGISACFKAVTSGGSLKIRGLTVPLNRPLTITGGLDGSAGWTPIQGAALSGAPLNVPGGLIGLSLTEQLLPGVTNITATTLLAGTPRINITALLLGQTALELPVKIRLNNVLLGGSCTIGSDGTPIKLRLGTGGRLGTPGFLADGSITTRGTTLSDSTFAVPAASGCNPRGLSLIQSLVTGVVNAKQGLPSGPGNNRATLISSSQIQPYRG